MSAKKVSWSTGIFDLRGESPDLKSGMGPDVPQPGNGVGIEKQPEALSRLNIRGQKRVHNANCLLTRSDQFPVVGPEKPNMLTRLQADRRCDRSDSDVN